MRFLSKLRSLSGFTCILARKALALKPKLHSRYFPRKNVTRNTAKSFGEGQHLTFLATYALPIMELKGRYFEYKRPNEAYFEVYQCER